MKAETTICDEIQRIMECYREQESSNSGVDTPGGLEHMGDVWRLLSKWDRLLAAEGRGRMAETLPTEAQREEFIKSFAYGNVKLHNPAITREMIDEQFELLKAEKSLPPYRYTDGTEAKAGDVVRVGDFGNNHAEIESLGPAYMGDSRIVAHFVGGGSRALDRLRKVDPTEGNKP